MTEFTIALFFLAIISLSQGEMREELERELELKPKYLSGYSGEYCLISLDCESLSDLDMETGIKLATVMEQLYTSLTITLDDYECIQEVRTYRTTSKDNWDPMECDEKECKCSGMDCSGLQPVVKTEIKGLVAASTEEIASCDGILADWIEISQKGKATFDIYELVLVDQDRATWKDDGNGDDGNEEDTDNGEDGHEGQYSLAVCHSINVVLSVIGLLIAIFL